MSKRPQVDLMALTSLTSEEAAPMREATQRSAAVEKAGRGDSAPVKPANPVRTEDLEPLNFKVPPAFNSRYRMCALTSKLKLNELLFEALDAWEEKRNRRS